MQVKWTIPMLVAYPKGMITSKMAADVTGMQPYWFNVAAKEGDMPMFRYVLNGRRLYINKADVMAYCGYAVDGSPLHRGSIWKKKSK